MTLSARVGPRGGKQAAKPIGPQVEMSVRPDAGPDAIAALFGEIARAAGAVIMTHYEAGTRVAYKGDGTPVTDADEAANALILAQLKEALPAIPVITEEKDWHDIDANAIADQFILVDPLDGTREFMARNGEFTVNIALIREGRPVAGAVFIPALGQLYLGGQTASLSVNGGPPQAISTRAYPVQGLTASISRSHLEPRTAEFVEKLDIAERISVGSALKFCRMAEGAVDVYPRFGLTMEWDTAAGHAVLSAAGGQVLTPDGQAFLYGKINDGFRNGPFIAWGRERLA